MGYQAGALEKRKTSLGLCWYIRFRAQEGDKTSRPRIRVGLVADLPTKAAARRAADQLRNDFNNPGLRPKPQLLFRDLIIRYEHDDMPERYSTYQSYRSMIRNHILPKWGKTPVAEIRPQDIKAWLKNLHTAPRNPLIKARPLAPKTIGHVKGLMSLLFRYAMFLEVISMAINPMSLFEIPSARKKDPRVLTRAEFKLLVSKINHEPFKTMVIVCGCLGLRVSELIGLRWEDIDWMKKSVTIRTGVVSGHVGELKTKASRKPLPLNPSLLEVLREHHRRSEFTCTDDWVFASPYNSGEKPYDPGQVRAKYIEPAAKNANLGAGVGWHCLRHSYRAWLGEGGVTMELQRDLMRHANISTTMDIYGATFEDNLRVAHESVVEKLLQ